MLKLTKSFKRFSYLIKNGQVVNADRSFKADVLIEKDKIVKVYEDNIKYELPQKCVIIDANGKYIIPGGIDPHTHMELPFMGEVAVDDFNTGTLAALSGGTTTIIDFLIPEDNQTLMQGYETWRKKADGKTNCDYALHCILTQWNDNIKEQMKDMIKYGVQSFKIFLAYKGALMMDESNVYSLLKHSKELGSIVLVHAENGQLIDEGQKEMLRLGITGPEGHYLSRPDIFEALATHQAITVSEYLSSPLYIVHLMSKLSSDEVVRARDRGVPVYGETLAAALGTDGRNMWNSNWDIAGPHVMSPPLNPDPTVKDQLMRHLHTGNIHTVGSDNCTFCLKMKKNGLDNFTKIPNGVNGVEDRLAVLWTNGVKKGYISKSEFVNVSSTNQAKIFNMYPRKGTIREGSDADIVIWNGDDERVISKNTHHQSVDFNVFEGMIVSGTAEKTFTRGRLVYDNKSGFNNKQINKGEYIERKPFGHVYERIADLTNRKNPLNYKVDRSSKSEENKMHSDFEEMRKLKYKLTETMKELADLKKQNKV